MKTLKQRFWQKVDRRGPDECWLWLAFIDPRGYGRIFSKDTSAPGGTANTYAHRYAYESEVGPITAGHVVRHTCGQKACCNPAHLYLATYSELSQSVMRKRAGISYKLTFEQMADIRAAYLAGEVTTSQLAAQYNVTQETIRKVLRSDYEAAPAPVCIVKLGSYHKVTPTMTQAIRQRYTPGITRMQDLANEYGISLSMVSRIISGERGSEAPTLCEDE